MCFSLVVFHLLDDFSKLLIASVQFWVGEGNHHTMVSMLRVHMELIYLCHTVIRDCEPHPFTVDNALFSCARKFKF
jgi:hypothetical protein